MTAFCYGCGTSLTGNPSFCHACGVGQGTTSTAIYSAEASTYGYRASRADGAGHTAVAAWTYAGATLIDQILIFEMQGVGQTDTSTGIGFFVGAILCFLLIWQVGCGKVWARTVLTVIVGIFSLFTLPATIAMLPVSPGLASFELVLAAIKFACFIAWYTSPGKEAFRN